MTQVVTFKMLNGQDLVGKLNTDESVRKDFDHIPNVIVVGDALVIAIRLVGDENDPKAQVSFQPVAIPVAGQGASRIGISPVSVAYQYPLESAYEDGYLRATSGLILAPGSGKLVV